MHPTSSSRRIAFLLALSAALVGCSGSTTDNPPAPGPAPAPPPAGVVSLHFLNNASANVYDQGSNNNPLSVQVSKDDRSADDVTITFSASPGTVSPVSTLPRGGVASTTLSVPAAAPTGAMSITASASATNTVSVPFPAYVRPRPEPLQVLVPAYFSASTDTTAWTTLTNSAQSYPDVHINVVVKPDNATNGIIPTGTYTPDTGLISAIDALKAANAHVKVLGYVATAGGSSGAISLADVQTTISQYATGYGAKLDGFYLDGMATDLDHMASFYQPLATHIAATTGMGTTPPLVAGNPASYPVKDYAAIAGVLVTFNGSAADYQNADPQNANAAWIYGGKNTAQATQVHSAATCAAMQAAVARANSPRMNTGWILVTDQTVGAPWTTLPDTVYWKSFLGTVDAINKGNPLPTC